MVKLIVFIPAFNEAETVVDVINAIPRNIESVDEVQTVVIDDGSTDHTAQVVESTEATLISHPQNLGIAESFRSGIKASLEHHATIAVSIDADMQFSPEDIPAIIAPILDGSADFVVANRFSDKTRPRGMPPIKYHGNHIMTRIVSWITGNHFHDVSSGFRAYSREALLNLNVQSSFTYTQESFIELATKGLSIAQVPVKVQYFPDRQSRVVSSVLRYTVRTLLTIARTTRDYMPLTLFGYGALALVVPSVALGIFVLFHYAMTSSFSPYIFLAFAAVYLFTLGAAMFVLGLVADMLRGTRANQERLLYFAKLHHYEKSNRVGKEVQ